MIIMVKYGICFVIHIFINFHTATSIHRLNFQKVEIIVPHMDLYYFLFSNIIIPSNFVYKLKEESADEALILHFFLIIF